MRNIKDDLLKNSFILYSENNHQNTIDSYSEKNETSMNDINDINDEWEYANNLKVIKPVPVSKIDLVKENKISLSKKIF